MALGESEVGEALDLVHNVVGHFSSDAAFGHSRVETRAHRCHARARSFRAHRLTQTVGLPRCETGDVDRHLHELLLEQRHTEGLLEALLEQRVWIRDRLLSVPAPEIWVYGTALDR